MNRRTFITAGAAALALSTQRVFGQMMQQLSGTVAVSELTGAEVDLGRTGFTFYGRLLDDRNNVETLGFSSETCDAAIRFIPAGTETETYLADRADDIAAQMDASEVVGTDSFSDGGWLALSVQTSNGVSQGMYLEVQLDAFSGYDLEIFLAANEESFEEDFDLMQQILLEGMEPFLFTEESEMPALIFSSAATTGSSRTGRASSTTGSQTTSGDSRSSGSGTSGRSGTTELDAEGVVEFVRDHQSQFMDEIDRFYEIVDMLGEEDSTEADNVDWFDELLDMMASWSAYPETAGAITFPPELSSLEATYMEWLDGVGEMGVTMDEWILGAGEIDDFLDAIGVAMQLNNALSAELRTLGVIIKPVEQGFALPADMRRRSLSFFVATRQAA